MHQYVMHVTRCVRLIYVVYDTYCLTCYDHENVLFCIVDNEVAKVKYSFVCIFTQTST